ncbi:MAG TPA: phosphoglucomutase/phosphomannomutase family protein, partial [Mucilaginibacter sp.]|nr:phosphoglucomutase/phosphomannomutase family protein [Mucilaginibacter sp.]
QDGNFVDSHHILLLLIHYMHKVKGMNGNVYSTFSCTSKIQKLCDAYGLKNTVTKIGFKYICDLIVNSGEPFLVGGEESGGIAVAGHIPERDGIWIGLIVWEFIAQSGRTLSELVQEIYDVVGKFAVERYDLHVTEEKKQQIISNCKKGYSSFGNLKVTKTEDMDGYKFHFEDESWVMIRPSGTEPVLRVYAEAPSSADSFKILDTVKGVLLS